MAVHVLAITLNIICCTFSIILVIWFIYRQQQSSLRWKIILDNLAFVSIVAFIISLVLASVGAMDLPFTGKAPRLLSWQIGELLIYIILFNRINQFNKSEYEATICFKRRIIELLLLYFICIPIYPICAVGVYDKNIVKYILRIWIITMQILQLIISILLINSFNRRTMKVTVDMHRKSVDDVSELNEDQEELVWTMTKHYLLSLIITVATHIVALFLCFEIFKPHNRIWFAVVSVIFPLGTFMIIICLFLLLSVNDNIYGSVCGCGIKIMESYFEKKMQKKMELKYRPLIPAIVSNDQNSDLRTIQNSNYSIYRVPSLQHTQQDDNL